MSPSLDSTLRALGAALIACAAVACDGSETVDAGDDPLVDAGDRLDSGGRDATLSLDAQERWELRQKQLSR